MKLLVLIYADVRLVIRLQIVCNGHIWKPALGNPDVFDKNVGILVLVSAALIAA